MISKLVNVKVHKLDPVNSLYSIIKVLKYVDSFCCGIKVLGISKATSATFVCNSQYIKDRNETTTLTTTTTMAAFVCNFQQYQRSQ